MLRSPADVARPPPPAPALLCKGAWGLRTHTQALLAGPCQVPTTGPLVGTPGGRGLWRRGVPPAPPASKQSPLAVPAPARCPSPVVLALPPRRCPPRWAVVPRVCSPTPGAAVGLRPAPARACGAACVLLQPLQLCHRPCDRVSLSCAHPGLPLAVCVLCGGTRGHCRDLQLESDFIHILKGDSATGTE